MQDVVKDGLDGVMTENVKYFEDHTNRRIRGAFTFVVDAHACELLP